MLDEPFGALDAKVRKELRASLIFQRQSFTSPNSQVFLHPHDVLIQTKPEKTTTPARIERIIHLGWEVEVELSLKDGQAVTAYITREDLDRLQLTSAQRVYIKPRKAKAFASVA